MAANTQAVNKIANIYKNLIVRQAHSNAASNIGYNTGVGLNSIKASTKKKFGEIERITFSAHRYLFIKESFGAGYKVSTLAGNKKKFVAGTGSPQPWISTAIEKYQAALADDIANTNADIAVKQINFKK